MDHLPLSVLCFDAPLLCFVLPAGMYSESFQTQLQHLCDIVLCVQSLADNSDIYRLLPDPTRYAGRCFLGCHLFASVAVQGFCVHDAGTDKVACSNQACAASEVR